MGLFTFAHVRFVKSAVKPEEYPLLRDEGGKPLLEIAVAGRSNVGKSTLLNQLFKRKDLVKTSATPGKTQLLNFFTADDELAFVDLPGYGYAKVPPEVRVKWGPMVQNYLETRNTLRLLLFLFDIRRLPMEEDLQLLAWTRHFDIPVILVLTKIDKVGRSICQSNTHKIRKGFGDQDLPVVHFSALANVGRRELIALMKQTLEADGPHKSR